jgi:GTP cyclohydrolase IA
MYVNEVFRGRYVAAPTITEFPNAEHLNELMIVGPITVRSACSHHFCPVIGRIWIGVMPNEHTNVIGLSKYARLAEWVMGRPANPGRGGGAVGRLDSRKNPARRPGHRDGSQPLLHGLARRERHGQPMINSVMRGVFLKDPNLRREFLSLIPKKGLTPCWYVCYTPAAPLTQEAGH